MNIHVAIALAFVFAGGIFVGRASVSLPGFVVSAPTPEPPRIGLAEVSDLITRLRPFAKKPDGSWYENGISLTFYGKGVNLELKQPNGNEYHGRGATLRDAVTRITEPAQDIRAALEGWESP